jgi:hypothetical protein
MTINWIRGFRRIGWVVTIPLAAFIIFLFYEETKEFRYQAIILKKGHELVDVTDQGRKDAPETISDEEMQRLVASGRAKPYFDYQEKQQVFTIQGRGFAYFSNDIPKETADKIVKDFELNHKQPVASPPAPHIGKYSDSDLAESWTFTVYRKVNKLKLTGLITGSFLISALIIQGSISILAWILGGFKGTSHIDVS